MCSRHLLRQPHALRGPQQHAETTAMPARQHTLLLMKQPKYLLKAGGSHTYALAVQPCWHCHHRVERGPQHNSSSLWGTNEAPHTCILHHCPTQPVEVGLSKTHVHTLYTHSALLLDRHHHCDAPQGRADPSCANTIQHNPSPPPTCMMHILSPLNSLQAPQAQPSRYSHQSNSS